MQNENNQNTPHTIQDRIIKSYTTDVHHNFVNMFANNIQIPISYQDLSQSNSNIISTNVFSSQNQKSES